MRKLLALVLLLGMASLANAGLLISVDGEVDPPDTEVFLYPSETAVIDIHGVAPQDPIGGYLIVEGSVGMDYSNVEMVYQGDQAYWKVLTLEEITQILPQYFPWPEAVIEFGFFDSADLEPVGLLLDGFILHCEAEDDVLLSLTDFVFNVVFDTQIIHQIPEPMTISLLALAGVVLLGKRRA